MAVAKQRVLVVDDEKDICTIIAKGLQMAGFQTESNVNPTDALSNFKAGKYDLAILDVKMSGIDGFELYERIRSMDRNLKVCFLTAFDIDVVTRFKQRFPQGDIPQFIRKPVELPKLVQTVKMQLGIR